MSHACGWLYVITTWDVEALAEYVQLAIDYIELDEQTSTYAVQYQCAKLQKIYYE